MSDVNTSTTTGTTVPKKNPALEAKKSNTNELLTMNNGRAIVQPLGGNTIYQTNNFSGYKPRDGASS